MKITPVVSPNQIPMNGTPESVRTAKAVAAFNKASQAPTQGQAQEHPVLNPNAVGVEEFGAIQAQTAQIIDKNTDNVDAPVDTQEPTPEKPKEDPALSRQFAQLARQERALRAKAQQQDQALKARETALAEREAKMQAQQPDTSNYISRDRLKQDALGVLDEAGISYDELTQQIINRQPTDPRINATINRLEAKIQQLEKANETTQKTYDDRQQQSYQAAVKQIELDARNLVKLDPNFETIKATGSIKDVVELITQTYDKDGILLSVEEAAQEVENYLVEEAMKLTKIEKIQRQLAKSNASAKPATQQTSQTKQTQPGMKTLTNATASQRQLSAKERAILAFKGELKS